MTGIVKKLVLTGGPCAGKSLCLSFLEQNLRDRGWHVLVAPEIPTMLMQHGVHPNMLSTFQEHVLAMQVAFEKELSRAAEMLPGEKVVIIYDRGIMDQKVYLPKYATVAMMAYSIYARPLTVPSMPTGTQPMHTALNQSSKLALLTNSPRKHGSERPTCGSFPTKEHSQISCITSSVKCFWRLANPCRLSLSGSTPSVSPKQSRLSPLRCVCSSRRTISLRRALALLSGSGHEARMRRSSITTPPKSPQGCAVNR